MQAAAQNPLISKAYGIIKTLSHDEEARLLAQSREKALRDAWNREEGARAEGGEEGKIIQAFESAKLMIKAGKLNLTEVTSFFPVLSSSDVERLNREFA